MWLEVSLKPQLLYSKESHLCTEQEAAGLDAEKCRKIYFLCRLLNYPFSVVQLIANFTDWAILAPKWRKTK